MPEWLELYFVGRLVNAPVSSKKSQRLRQIPFNLPADLLLDLDAFSEAHYGAPRVKIVKEALRDFIHRQVEAEPQLRQRFLEARSRLNREAGVIKLLDSGQVPSSDSD